MLIILKGLFWIVFIVGVVILIHEAGHFAAAKLLHVRVEEFALGFGKKIFAWKIGETTFRINMIPYGGYVKLLGEEEESKKSDSFSTKSLLVKSIVVVAGITMNLIFAVLIFYGVLASKGFQILLPKHTEYRFIGAEIETYNKPYIAEVIEGTPADEADFPVNSIIWSIDDCEIKSIDDFQNYLSEHEGEEIDFKVLVFGDKWWESGEWRSLKIVPREMEKEGVLLGVKYDGGVAVYYKLDYSSNKLFSGISHSINFAGYNFDVLKELVLLSFREKTVKPVSENVSGVVGLANVTFDLVKVGDIWDILNLMGVTNLLLAIMNILPIPALDGGYLMFFVIEKIRGKKLSKKYEEWSIKIGFIFLITLGVLITIKDIIQFEVITRIINAIKNLF
jgi:regulator of sigma E protease